MNKFENEVSEKDNLENVDLLPMPKGRGEKPQNKSKHKKENEKLQKFRQIINKFEKGDLKEKDEEKGPSGVEVEGIDSYLDTSNLTFSIDIHQQRKKAGLSELSTNEKTEFQSFEN